MSNYEYEAPLPGMYIQEEIDARGWSQRDLAFILGIEETALNKIVKGKTGVSLEMSKALAAVFDIDADFFANLQKAYDLAHSPAADPAIARRASLQSRYPVREMIKRGWLQNTEVGLLEVQLARFLKAENDNAMHHRHAARKTNYGEPADEAQLAWLHRVIQIAETLKDFPPYSEKALLDARHALKALMEYVEGVQRVPEILAECGVRFVIVEGLTNAKIDGVCIWLNSETPVIGMSLRFDRIDNFWFVLWHEIAHILNRDGKSDNGWILDIELEKEVRANNEIVALQEKRANALAAENCVPQHEIISFAARRTFFSERDVVAFAKQMRVHPGILVGQIQKRTGRWELLRKHLVRVREYIMPTAVVDGWGHISPVSI